MKYFIILGLIALSAIGNFAAVVTHNNPASAAVVATASSLSQDLNELKRLVPVKPIRQLITRYLLNDAEFQTFVRIINSNDAYLTQMNFWSQPEITNFSIWLRTQVMLSGGELNSDESVELIGIRNRNPFWSNNVSGWQGFVNEFLMYYPQESIRVYVQAKVAENGIIAELMLRLRDLKPVYDRVIVLPAAQRVAAALQANGIDVLGLDTFIRNQFGWQRTNANPGVLATSGIEAVVV